MKNPAYALNSGREKHTDAKTTKTTENVYDSARIWAAAYNDQLLTRSIGDIARTFPALPEDEVKKSNFNWNGPSRSAVHLFLNSKMR